VKGLLAILGKSKGLPEEEKDDAAEDSDDGEDMSSSFKSEALSAAKEGDLEGLANALMGYAKACKGK
jgi:hypothetical protein